MRLQQIARVVVHVNSFKPPPTGPGLNGALLRGDAESERAVAAYREEMKACTSAIEFARRCVERRAAASNPKCKVEVKHRADDFRPTVLVEYGTRAGAPRGRGERAVPPRPGRGVLTRATARGAQRMARSSSSTRGR